MQKFDLSMSRAHPNRQLCIMNNAINWPLPPWDMESAAARLRLLEDDFNTRDPRKVSANYTDNAEVRFGTEFLTGREEIGKYLVRDFSQKSKFTLKLDLWGALKGRMAVRYELEWTDETGRSFKSYGVEVLQFEEHGLIDRNFVSFNHQAIP